jgi:hypothetical protein
MYGWVLVNDKGRLSRAADIPAAFHLLSSNCPIDDTANVASPSFCLFELGTFGQNYPGNG